MKALFRPCAMITPDMDLICEIMLMSEGYSNGKVPPSLSNGKVLLFLAQQVKVLLSWASRCGP